MPAQQQSRKDILQAYRLMTERTALALIAGEPDSPNQPLRRRSTATISGILVGVIAVALSAVLGIIHPGGAVKGLTAANNLTIDKDTGTSYVPCKFNGQEELCPALNYASALLALDNAQPNTQKVSQAALAGYTIGPTVGIAGLPQDLPTAGNLMKKTDPWAVCSADGQSTLIGGQPVGGTELGANQAALASDTSGTSWVLWNGTRMKITKNAMGSLFGTATPVQVPISFVNAIPEGPDFKAPFISGMGTPVHGPTGTANVGQVYSSGAGSYWVLESSGKLAPITKLQSDLYNLVPGSQGTQNISLSQTTGQVDKPISSKGMPGDVPKAPTTVTAPCVTFDQNHHSHVVTGASVPAGATVGGGGNMVDKIALPAGHGALIGVTADAVNAPKVLSWFLLVGSTRYGMTSSAVPGVLGYNLADDEVVLPASVVGLIPQGAVLDPKKASQRAFGSGSGPGSESASPAASG